MNVKLADGEKYRLLDSRNGVIINPMEKSGDLIVGGEDGAPSRLCRGKDGQILRSTEDGIGWDDENEYVLPIATEDVLGGVKVGERLTMANCVLSADKQNYALPIATTETLGGIRPDGTTISANKTTGVASVIGGGGGEFPRFQMLTNTSIHMFPRRLVLCLRRRWFYASGGCG
jgi:hypothetical protein